jgi:hypothetical protein
MSFNIDELKKQFIGLTIEDINADMNHENDVYTLKIKLSDGSELVLEPGHSSDGGRKLRINE